MLHQNRERLCPSESVGDQEEIRVKEGFTRADADAMRRICCGGANITPGPLFRYVLALDDTGEAIGCATFFPVVCATSGLMNCLDYVVTCTKHQRRGVARRLVRAVVGLGQRYGACRTVWEVARDNDPAIRLYHSIGAVFDEG